MERLARFVIRRRRLVVLVWIGLTIFGIYGAGQVNDRWFQRFSIPGYSAYETNQKILKIYGSGESPPWVLTFTAKGDVTKVRGIDTAIAKAVAVDRGSRVSSYFNTHNDTYLSPDRHTMFAVMHPGGHEKFNTSPLLKVSRRAMKAATPAGVESHLTGIDPLFDDAGEGGGSSLGLEIALGGVGALIILMFVFGTLPAVAIPLAVATSSILTTFSLIWLLTYITDVSIIVQFLVALIGLGVAIDYSLLMIFRFREELRTGEDPETALVQTMTHAGRSVIVSGSTVAIGLLSMVILPLPFLRSIGIGGMLIPTVSVCASITLLPAFLAMLGPRINNKRVMPKRFAHAGDPESGFWSRWANGVLRRPGTFAALGLVVVGLLLIPASKLNPSDAQVKDFPGKGDAVTGRNVLAKAGVSPGVLRPFEVLARNATPAQVDALAARLRATPGIAGATAPAEWRIGPNAVIEALPAVDGSSDAIRGLISHVKDDVLPAAQGQSGGTARFALGGNAPEQRDFVHAVYGNFPFVLLFVVVLTFLLLARAFRSLLLALKAVILNLLSLGAAYGIVVFVFQQGHGSQAIYSTAATQSISPWIPLMIFAFLFGLSMDYEVFMLTRIREAYDETGDTKEAIASGLSHTGKLVTSAALILMFAFFALSTGPGIDIKEFGTGLAAGIIFDATVIRALLVPSIMQLMGKWNWWFPEPAAKLLMVKPRPRPPRPAPESA